MGIKQIFGNLVKPRQVYRANQGEYIDGYYRIAGGEVVEGEYVAPPAFEEISIDAVIMPNKEKRMQYGENSSNEAINLEGSIKIYSDEPFKTKNSKNITEADKILYQDNIYKIHSVAIWDQDPSFIYHKAIAILTEESI